MHPVWHCSSFEALTPAELYALLRLRLAVFSVEQRCIYQDLDGLDHCAHHLLGLLSPAEAGCAIREAGGAIRAAGGVIRDADCAIGSGQPLHMHAGRALVAYARCLPPGAKFPEPSVGRVVVDPGCRGRGLGHMLLRRALAVCAQRYPDRPVRISAQAYLERFYAAHGFQTQGEAYLEDGIAHREMLRAADAKSSVQPLP